MALTQRLEFRQSQALVMTPQLMQAIKLLQLSNLELGTFVEAELLPGVLLRNAALKFVCRDVHLKIERSDTPFTRGYNAGQVIRVPVAHGEGNYEADHETIERLEGEGRVVFRYCDPAGNVTTEANANGAQRNIAGIADPTGRATQPMIAPPSGFVLQKGERPH